MSFGKASAGHPIPAVACSRHRQCRSLRLIARQKGTPTRVGSVVLGGIKLILRFEARAVAATPAPTHAHNFNYCSDADRLRSEGGHTAMII